MYSEKIKSFAIAIITVLGLLLTAPVANAWVGPSQCSNQTISDGETINGNLTIPANATCTLTNVTVSGNVQVGQNATLEVNVEAGQKVTVNGNIVAHQCNSVFISTTIEGGTVSIDGNVNIQRCTQADGAAILTGAITISGNFVCSHNSSICDAETLVIYGNLTMDNNSSQTHAGGSAVIHDQVSGNVDFSGNSSTLGNGVIGNTIGGNLRCRDNSPVPGDGGQPNKVSGNKTGQCENL